MKMNTIKKDTIKRKSEKAGFAMGFIALATAAALGGCASSAGPLESVSLESSGSGIGFRIEPGPAWESLAWYFIIPVTKTPQLAVWLETEDGRYLKTLYVSSKASSGSWLAAPKGGRPQALPAWEAARRSGGAGAGPAASGGPGPADAVSGATPGAGSALGMAELAMPEAMGKVRLRLEASKRYDYNEAWPEASSGVDGQPSVVWEAILRPDGAVVDARPAGRGSLEYGFAPGLEGFTSALDIVARAQAWWKP